MMNPENKGYDQGAPPAYPQGGAPAGSYPPQAQTVVVTQPVHATGVVVGNAPPNYLVGSILSCVFCFWPTGLAAIYFALQVNTMMSQGNMAEAEVYSKRARMFMIISIVVGAIMLGIIIIMQIAAAASYSAAVSKSY